MECACVCVHVYVSEWASACVCLFLSHSIDNFLWSLTLHFFSSPSSAVLLYCSISFTGWLAGPPSSTAHHQHHHRGRCWWPVRTAGSDRSNGAYAYHRSTSTSQVCFQPSCFFFMRLELHCSILHYYKRQCIAEDCIVCITMQSSWLQSLSCL